jgi:predicted transcriptional regulator
MPKLAIIMITLSVLVMIAVTYMLVSGTKRAYRNAKKKFSDRQLLELFMANNYVLTIKQIIQLSPMTMSEVSLRMHTWVNNGVMRSLYANDGSTHYQVKTKLPSTNKIYDWKKMPDQEVLEKVLEHTEGYELSPAHFVWLFDMTIQEARKFLKQLVANGFVKSHYNNSFQRVYISNINHRGQEVGGNEKVEIASLEAANDGRIRIDDSEILKLAIENDGRLTPTLICVEKKISLDDAQEVLDKLYEKGAFHIEVDEYDGMIEYWLRDSKLYRK